MADEAEKTVSEGIKIFYGEFHHQIDEKGRFRIPAKLRAQLGAHPFITRSSNNSLLVLPEEEAERMFERKFGDVDFTDPVKNRALRIMAASGFPAEEDKQGRILLPGNLIKHAQIEKNIVTVGVYKRVEIWSEENWEKYIDIPSDEFDKCLTEI